MRITGIIPARYASSRFPGKPLADIAGKTMIQRVYEQALKANLDNVIVATDDDRIADHVRSFGGNVVITSSSHNNGTERIAEVAKTIDTDVVVNIQGDEPFIQPEQIQLLTDCFKNEQVQIATLAKASNDIEAFQRDSIVKVVLDSGSSALYFSRSAIPFYRTAGEKNFFKHVGIYAFKRDVLLQLVQLPVSTLEKAEMLEQLRWLQNGYKITVALTVLESISVDVPEDLVRAIEYAQKGR